MIFQAAGTVLSHFRYELLAGGSTFMPCLDEVKGWEGKEQNGGRASHGNEGKNLICLDLLNKEKGMEWRNFKLIDYIILLYGFLSKNRGLYILLFNSFSAI